MIKRHCLILLLCVCVIPGTHAVITQVQMYQKELVQQSRSPIKKTVVYFVYEDRDFEPFETSDRQNEEVIDQARRLGALVITRDLLDQEIKHDCQDLEDLIRLKKDQHDQMRHHAFEHILSSSNRQAVTYSGLTGFAQQCREQHVRVANVESGQRYGFFANGSLYNHAALLRSVHDKIKDRLDYYESFDKSPEHAAVRTLFEPCYLLGTLASWQAQRAIQILHQQKVPPTPDERDRVAHGLNMFNNYYINTSMFEVMHQQSVVDTVFICSHKNTDFEAMLGASGYSHLMTEQVQGGSRQEDRIAAAGRINIPRFLSCLTLRSPSLAEEIVLPRPRKRVRLQINDEEKQGQGVEEQLICNRDDRFSLLSGGFDEDLTL